MNSINVDAIRDDFPILSQPHPSGRPVVYLDSGASAQKPRAVIDAISDCYSGYYANAYRGVYYFGSRVDDALEGTREKLRELLNAEEVEEIVYTSGSTMSINLVARGWGLKHLKPGDEILLNVMEHHANLVPWQMVAQRTGAVLKYLPLTLDGRLDLEQLPAMLTPRTRLMAVTGMSNVLGTIVPLDEIIPLCHQNGTLVLVDGAQIVPHSQLDMRALDIDFLAFSGHKFYGPSGVGVLYGKRHLLEEMDPVFGGGHMIDQVFLDHSTWAEIPAKFEAGTLPIGPIVGLGAAIDYVSGIGFEAIHRHEQELLYKAHRVLSEIPGLTILGPDVEHKGSIVSFTIEQLHPHDIADWLDRRGIAVRAGHHCTMPLHEHLGIHASTRASFGMYNTLDEVDLLAEALEYTLKKHHLPA
ncbi:MAG TPA: SufS family cysteine desulfurase [Planctomycetaceae bacterium]|nr:SufS family cysteine desulfurase [Planctomycetaceae bacterium]